MIRQKAKKIISLGLRIADFAKKETLKELKPMINKKIITAKQGKKIAKALVKELIAEKKRFEAFIKQELKTELKKAKKILRK